MILVWSDFRSKILDWTEPNQLNIILRRLIVPQSKRHHSGLWALVSMHALSCHLLWVLSTHRCINHHRLVTFQSSDMLQLHESFIALQSPCIIDVTIQSPHIVGSLLFKYACHATPLCSPSCQSASHHLTLHFHFVKQSSRPRGKRTPLFCFSC